MNQTLNDLQWKKFPALNDGFVTLVDVMGDDASVAQAARVSYGKDKRNARRSDFIGHSLDSEITCSACGDMDGCHKAKEVLSLEEENKEITSERHLIRYLMRHRHTTPFEMAEIKLLVRVPMDCWRQWIRHRTANVNEYSTRYTEAIDSMQKTDSKEWRNQCKTNKQGSADYIEEWPNGDVGGDELSRQEVEFHGLATNLYKGRLQAGVAKEQARKDLPLSTYTEAYWKIDLHNMFHFLGLRMDSHAQKEIREYATIIGEQIVKPLFPACWEAFEDYRLGGMFLTRLDRLMIVVISRNEGIPNDVFDHMVNVKEDFIDWRNSKSREREECRTKLEYLGILSPF